MNKLKKITLTILSLSVIACVATACKEQRTELTAPQNLKIQSEILTWDEVENAQCYLVTVNDEQYETQTNSLDVFEITDSYTTYQFQVTALSEDEKYLDSAPSLSISYTLERQPFSYAVTEDGNCHVKVAETPPKGKLIIPETVDGYPVTQIVNHAFRNCAELTSVLLPDTVTEIGMNAFYGCSNLERVRLPQDLETINSMVFWGCDLKKIDLPEFIQTIKFGAFTENKNLKELILPENLESLDSAFTNCNALEKIELPRFLYQINETKWLFSQCPSLKSLTVHEENKYYKGENNCIIAKQKTYLGTPANTLIAGCAGSVIPDGVTAINQYAFYMCTALKEIQIPQTVTTIGFQSFYDCTSLQELYIPQSVTSIETNAFNGCSGVQRIEVAAGNPVYKSDQNCIIRKADNVLVQGCATSTIPDYVKEIGDYAFKLMRLKSFVFPEGLEKIGNFAFVSNSFEEISLPASLKVIGIQAFCDCRELVKVRLSYGITTIKSGAFVYCQKLQYINLPESITEISPDAFNNAASGRTSPLLSLNVPSVVYDNENVGFSTWNTVYTDSETSERRAAFKYDNEIPYVYSFTFSKGDRFSEAPDIPPPIVPAREGYTFVGWTLEEGSSNVAVGIRTYTNKLNLIVNLTFSFDELRPYLTDIWINDYNGYKTGFFTQDLTLYAIWQPNE